MSRYSELQKQAVTPDTSGQTASTVVNYVWVCNKDPDDPFQPIPTHLFHKLQKNAAQYPDTPFNLWVEDPAVCAPYAIPDNVKICSLDDLERMKHLPFSPTDPSYFWAKVDLARLFVLEKCLQRQDVRTAIYSDFDITDISLTSPGLTSRLEQFGVAYGATNGLGVDKIKELAFENGYLAFGAKPAALELLSTTIDEALKSKDLHHRNGVYAAMEVSTYSWVRNGSGQTLTDTPRAWREQIGGFKVADATCVYVDTDLVAEPATRVPTRPAVTAAAPEFAKHSK